MKMKEKRWSFFSSALFCVILAVIWTVGMTYVQSVK